MNISLTPALEKYVQDKVATGLYNSVSEVIREALRLFIAQESIPQERLQQLTQDVEIGLKDTKIYDGHLAMKELINKYE